jgi:hypothetical protein
MWRRTVVSEEKKQFLLPILVFEVGSAECFLNCSHETFRLRIGFSPLRSDLSVVKPHVLRELGERLGGPLSDLISAGMPCVDKKAVKFQDNGICRGGANNLNLGIARVFVDYHEEHIAGGKRTTEIDRELLPGVLW